MRSKRRATQRSPAAGARRRISFKSQPTISRPGSANQAASEATTAARSSGDRRSTQPRRSPDEEATASATGEPASASATVTSFPTAAANPSHSFTERTDGIAEMSRTAGGGRLRARRNGGVELGEQGEELELRVELAQEPGVGRIELQRLGMDLDRQVGVDGDQLLREQRLRAMGQQPLAVGLARHLGGALEQRLDRAELGDQLPRPLLADSRYAGHVVDRVAHQRQDVGDLLRRHAEILRSPPAAS